MFSQDIIDRFWSKVDKTSAPDGHWLWTDYVSPQSGYGQFHFQDTTGHAKTIRAHRFACILLYGPLPKGICALHKPPCLLRHCVRHVYAGTHADNMKDMLLLQRSAAGEKHAMAKLTAEDVFHIRLLGHGPTQKALATEFGVSESDIACIQKGATWFHIAGPTMPKRRNRGSSKLTPEQVHAIRRTYTGRYGQQRQLAKEYGVKPITIYTLIHGRTYQNV